MRDLIALRPCYLISAKEIVLHEMKQVLRDKQWENLIGSLCSFACQECNAGDQRNCSPGLMSYASQARPGITVGKTSGCLGKNMGHPGHSSRLQCVINHALPVPHRFPPPDQTHQGGRRDALPVVRSYVDGPGSGIVDVPVHADAGVPVVKLVGHVPVHAAEQLLDSGAGHGPLPEAVPLQPRVKRRGKACW